MINPKDLIIINQLLEIQKEEDFQKGISKFYPSRVEEVDGDNIIIGTPIEKSSLVDLKPGTIIILWFNLPLANYALFCKVTARIYEPLPLTLLEWPFKVKRIQRRAYVRIPVCLELEFSKGEVDAEDNEIYYSALTGDLSGGGLNFTTSVKLHTFEQLKLILHLPKGKKLNLEGKILWVNFLEQGRYQAGIEFIKISEGLRDLIIVFLFDRQRELLKKGLLE